MYLWNSKVVLITGASSGIGLELSKELCRRGAKVIGLARSLDRLRRIEGLCKNFKGIKCDLINYEDIKEAISKVRKYYGRIDVLINNAGGGLAKRLIEHTVSEFEYITKLNYISVFNLIHEALPLILKSKEGVIVNVITAGVFVYLRRLPSYGAAKSALHYLSQILREELKEYGIRVICIYPGVVKTEFFRRAGMTQPKKGIEPKHVVRSIIKAIEDGKENVFIPSYLRLLTALAKIFPIRVFI